MSEGMAFHDVYLGLGANIGDSAKTGMIYEAISAAYDCAIALE